MTICRINQHYATDLRVGSVNAINNSFVGATASKQHGNAEDITKIYDSVNKSRLGIAGKLKGIARIINDSLDNYEFNVVTDDNSTNEANDDGVL